MFKVLLITHGKLCLGMLDTIKIFTSHIEHITAIPFYIEEEGWDADAALHEYIEAIQEEDIVLVFTDILWGSINQKMMVQLGKKLNVHIVTGMNLPVILELISCNPDEIDHSMIALRTKGCQESIVYMKEYQFEFQDEDE